MAGASQVVEVLVVVVVMACAVYRPLQYTWLGTTHLLRTVIHIIDEATGGGSNGKHHLYTTLALPNPGGWARRRGSRVEEEGGDPATPGFLQRPWPPARPLPPPPVLRQWGPTCV
ncbi:hypothetical protein E2C01_004009 [Portunus trituberculatus]|uniref:Uncharacterized protein n=1 Tax=Portunus trituberculatus TaxID=210409 RepID=A0A5B7CSP0_PORTR|nr:hypothetical protein [Portunus trituberculatus]